MLTNATTDKGRPLSRKFWFVNSEFLTLLYNNALPYPTTYRHLRSVADSEAHSTRRSLQPVADLTAPTTCRRLRHVTDDTRSPDATSRLNAPSATASTPACRQRQQTCASTAR